MRQSLFSGRFINAVAALTFVCALSFSAFATTNNKTFAGVSIDNFGQVNDHIYRGAQPKDSQYRELAALGVKTVVDLRGDAKRESQASAERAGLRYINLPLEDKSYPQTDAAARFLQIVSDPDNGVV